MLHADVDGSLEALTSSLLAVNTGSTVYKVVTAAVGQPSFRDVQMAHDTGACIVSFGVSMPTAVQRDADMRGVATVQSECALRSPCMTLSGMSSFCVAKGGDAAVCMRSVVNSGGACSVIYKLLDSLSSKLVASAPKLEERVTAGEVEVAAMFHASVKKSVSSTGKVKIAGCKVRADTPYVNSHYFVFGKARSPLFHIWATSTRCTPCLPKPFVILIRQGD
jgi:hypothetical protein